MSTLAERAASLSRQPQVKVVRHVRTPSGARKYGQPIGTVIVTDKVPRTPDASTVTHVLEAATRAAGGSKPRKAAAKKVPASKITSKTPVKKDGFFNWHASGDKAFEGVMHDGTDTYTAHIESDGYTWKGKVFSGSDQIGGFSGEWGFDSAMVRAKRIAETHKDIADLPKNPLPTLLPSDVMLNAKDNQHYIPGYPDVAAIFGMDGSVVVRYQGKVAYRGRTRIGDNFKQTVVQAVQYHYGKKQRKNVRNKNPLQNDYAGVYGKDWVNEGDEEAFDFYAKGESERYGLALEHAEQLGVVFHETHGQIDIDFMEAINALQQAYEEKYPGFGKAQGHYGIAPDAMLGSDRTVAYNYSTQQAFGGIRETDGMGRLNHIDYKGTVIGLNYRFFGTDSSAKTRMAVSGASNEQQGWWAQGSHTNDLMSQEQYFALKTVNHEIGHTIGRIATGTMSWQKDEEYFKWAMENIFNHLYNYDVISADDHANLMYGLDTMSHGDLSKPMDFNNYALSKHLSMYGTSSLHELMAETWSEYTMNDNPSQFSFELGQLMEDALKEYLAGLED